MNKEQEHQSPHDLLDMDLDASDSPDITSEQIIQQREQQVREDYENWQKSALLDMYDMGCIYSSNPDKYRKRLVQWLNKHSNSGTESFGDLKARFRYLVRVQKEIKPKLILSKLIEYTDEHWEKRKDFKTIMVENK